MIPPQAICFFGDGDKWCCVFGDFIDLGQSPAGYGDNWQQAFNDLIEDAKKDVDLTLDAALQQLTEKNP